MSLLTKLRFLIHPVKSVLVPVQMKTFLGFILDSVQMLVRPTLEKAQKLKTTCGKLLTKPEVTVQELAEAIGIIVSNFPGVEFASFFIEGWNKTKVVSSNKVKEIFCPNSSCPQMLLQSLIGGVKIFKVLPIM